MKPGFWKFKVTAAAGNKGIDTPVQKYLSYGFPYQGRSV
jgi:hypothetical protein